MSLIDDGRSLSAEMIYSETVCQNIADCSPQETWKTNKCRVSMQKTPPFDPILSIVWNRDGEMNAARHAAGSVCQFPIGRKITSFTFLR